MKMLRGVEGEARDRAGEGSGEGTRWAPPQNLFQNSRTYVHISVHSILTFLHFQSTCWSAFSGWQRSPSGTTHISAMWSKKYGRCRITDRYVGQIWLFNIIIIILHMHNYTRLYIVPLWSPTHPTMSLTFKRYLIKGLALNLVTIYFTMDYDVGNLLFWIWPIAHKV